jgi:hypothetical protein
VARDPSPVPVPFSAIRSRIGTTRPLHVCVAERRFLASTLRRAWRHKYQGRSLSPRTEFSHRGVGEGGVGPGSTVRRPFADSRVTIGVAIAHRHTAALQWDDDAVGTADVPEVAWPTAIARLEPELIMINSDGIYITIKAGLDGGWGCFFPRSARGLPEPLARFEEVEQGVYYWHPF